MQPTLLSTATRGQKSFVHTVNPLDYLFSFLINCVIYLFRIWRLLYKPTWIDLNFLVWYKHCYITAILPHSIELNTFILSQCNYMMKFVLFCSLCLQRFNLSWFLCLIVFLKCKINQTNGKTFLFTLLAVSFLLFLQFIIFWILIVVFFCLLCNVHSMATLHTGCSCGLMVRELLKGLSFGRVLEVNNQSSQYHT